MADRLYHQLTEESIAPAKGGHLLLTVVVPLLVLLVLCVSSYSPYLRFNRMQDDAVKLKWVYERIHFDETPIDIALIGTSRTMVGINGEALEGALVEKTDNPVRVANLAVSWQGRNMHYLLTKELLKSKECDLIIVEVQESLSRQGHKLFADLADTPDLLTAPLVINKDYFQDVSGLGHRNSRLFLESLSSRLKGNSLKYDNSSYVGSHFISDHDTVRTAEYMAAETASFNDRKRWRVLPEKYDGFEFNFPRVYLEKIVNLAQENETRLVFLYLPYFGSGLPPKDAEFFSRNGGLLVPPNSLLANPRLWSDVTHLNTKGSELLTAWLADHLLSGPVADR